MGDIRGRPWIVLTALGVVGFLVNASTFAALGVVLPAMVRDLRLTWTQGGLGFTLLGAACGASSLLPAVMIRRVGVRVTLIGGTMVMAAGFLCLAKADGALMLYGGAILLGMGYQMMALIPGTHVLAAVFPRRGLPFGAYFTFIALGGVAGPWLVWLSRDVFHGDWRMFWEAQLIGAAAAGAVCALLIGGGRQLEAMAKRTDDALAQLAHRPSPAGGRPPGADWTVRLAVRTPQFLILLAAYFGHLLVGSTIAGLSVAHLTERGVSATVAGGMLSLEALAQTAARAGASALGDRVSPKTLLLAALASLAVGAAALSLAHGYLLMLVYAVGSGLGFGLTALAVTLLLLDYFGRAHNLELFSLTCLVGAVAALGPAFGGVVRDATGSFALAFQMLAGAAAVIFLAALFMRPPDPARRLRDQRG